MRVERLYPCAIPSTTVATGQTMHIGIRPLAPCKAVRLVLPPTRLQLLDFRIGTLSLSVGGDVNCIDLGVGLDWFLPGPTSYSVIAHHHHVIYPEVGAILVLSHPGGGVVAGGTFATDRHEPIRLSGACLWCERLSERESP